MVVKKLALKSAAFLLPPFPTYFRRYELKLFFYLNVEI